jgi:hypothetical protein
MSEGYQPYPSTDAETELLPSIPPSAPPIASSGGQSTTEVTKEQAAEVAQTGVEAGRHVASVAKEQAGNVTSEAGRQAQNLLGQARSELGRQAGTQQQRVADGLKSLSQQLHSMSQHSDQPGLAADLARQGAQVTEQAASWFDGRDPGALLDEVRSFARRRPGSFLLLAAGAGLLAGRLTRGLKDQSSDGSESGQAAGPSSSELTTGGAALDYPEEGGLTTGLPGGGYAGSAGYPAGAGFAGGVPPAGSGFAGGIPPAGDGVLPTEEFGFPATGNPR